jgi:hypothetical protein
MHLKLIVPLVLLLASFGVSQAGAQQPTAHGEHEGGLSPAPEELSRETRALGRSILRLREQIHETNRWMIVHGSTEGLHGVGTEMAHAGEHLQELVRRLDEAWHDPEVARDAAQRRRVDALADQVQAVERELSRTLITLRAAVAYR